MWAAGKDFFHKGGKSILIIVLEPSFFLYTTENLKKVRSSCRGKENLNPWLISFIPHFSNSLETRKFFRPSLHGISGERKVSSFPAPSEKCETAALGVGLYPASACNRLVKTELEGQRKVKISIRRFSFVHGKKTPIIVNITYNT